MVLFSLVIVAVGIEIAMQIKYRSSGTLQEKVWYIYSGERIRQEALLYNSVPFVGYITSNRSSDHNAMGYRGPEIELPKPPDIFRIVAVGGSTTYGIGVAESDSWPRLLEGILRDEYGYSHVEVVNMGAVGYTTWNSLSNFEFRGLEMQPDMLMVYHGINDIGIRTLPPECYNAYTPFRGLAQSQWRDDISLSRSALYRYIGIRVGWVKNPIDLGTWLRPMTDFYPCDADPVPPEEAYAANPPIYFERNLRSLVGVARAHDVSVVLSTWAFLPGHPENVSQDPALHEHNEVVKRLAQDMDVPLIDLMGELPEDPDYWLFDYEHQSVAGTHVQAQLYAAFLVENDLIPPP
jgi:lysophospholipase L1-like esterase